MKQANNAYDAYLVNEFARLFPTFKDTNSFLEHLHEQIEREQLDRIKMWEGIANVLRKYKWPVPRHMPTRLLLDAAKIGKLKGNHSSDISKLLIAYFSHNNFKALSDLVESWNVNPLFKHRMKILQDCVAVLKSPSISFNPSNVILPTLNIPN